MNLVGYQENHWEEEGIQALLLTGQTIITSILYRMNDYAEGIKRDYRQDAEQNMGTIF